MTELVMVVVEADTERKALGDLMEAQGHGVIAAASAFEARRLLRQFIPDTVLMGVRYGSRELSRWIRESPFCQGLRVLMVQRESDRGAIEELMGSVREAG